MVRAGRAVRQYTEAGLKFRLPFILARQRRAAERGRSRKMTRSGSTTVLVGIVPIPAFAGMTGKSYIYCDKPLQTIPTKPLPRIAGSRQDVCCVRVVATSPPPSAQSDGLVRATPEKSARLLPMYRNSHFPNRTAI